MTGKIYSTCGHLLTDLDGRHGMGYNVNVKEWSRGCTPAVAYMNLCKDCRIEYMEEGLVLYTEEDEDSWYRGGFE